MSASRVGIALLLALSLVSCAAMDGRQADASTSQSVSESTLLVMLRAAAPHFRPDNNYGSGYNSAVGREARRRIAEAIAAQYGLRLLDSWPMPALGVDCFVMQVSEKAALAGLLEQLSADPRVESAQALNLFHVLAHNDPLYPLQPSATLWHLSDLHKMTTRRRVRVAQVDTGVETGHPDLAGQIAITRNFVDVATWLRHTARRSPGSSPGRLTTASVLQASHPM